jgi:predicted NUDIX family NTP pyrophosphohydrolase
MSDDTAFVGRNLRDVHFEECDLSGVVMRGVVVDGMDIDSPWLGGDGSLVVNGVDVAAFVDEELDRRFPGRAGRMAADPDGLRAAWKGVEGAWTAAVERARTMPEGALTCRSGASGPSLRPCGT